MKSFFTLFPSLSFLVQMSLSQAGASPVVGVPYCMNPPYLPGEILRCDTCEDREGSESDSMFELNCDPFILNSGFRYFSSAPEFQTHTVGPGCTPCGTGSSQKSDLPSLELNRFYNIRGNDTPFLSFGFATGLEHYDVSLRFLANQSPIVYHPSGKADDDRVGRFDASRGGWRDNSNQGPGFYAIQLFTLAGTPITADADRNLAHTATILHHDGSTTHFEVFWKQSGEAWARPIAFMDRHGNAIEITYSDPHFDTVTNPVLDVASYFKKDKIKDAYGREASLSYQQVSGRNVVNKIIFPNGEEITYEYGSFHSIGNPMVKKATHPDGSESTFTSAIIAPANLVELTVSDVHAGLGNRQKKLLFSRGSGINEAGQTISTAYFN